VPVAWTDLREPETVAGIADAAGVLAVAVEVVDEDAAEDPVVAVVAGVTAVAVAVDATKLLPRIFTDLHG
jgi:hypothetical protein